MRRPTGGKPWQPFARRPQRLPVFALVAAAWLLALGWPGGFSPCHAAQPTFDLNRRRASQQQARRLSNQLVTGLVEPYIRRLKENHLTNTPLHHDLRAMRTRIERLTNQGMSDVLDLLNQARRSEPQARTRLLARAQDQTQTVLDRLLAERRRIRGRLKYADLIAEVQRLIEQQTQTRQSTRVLHLDDEQAQLLVLGSQQNVQTLYRQFVQTLDQARGWPGKVSTAADKAAQAVQDENLAGALDSARNGLVNSKLADAAASQKRVITGLETVLERLRQAGDPLFDPTHASEALREIVKRQRQVRKRVKADQLKDDQHMNELIKAQDEIGDQIAELKGGSSKTQTSSQALKRAEQASDKAKRAIFNARQSQAQTQQTEVIRALTQSANQAESAKADTTARPNNQAPGQGPSQTQAKGESQRQGQSSQARRAGQGAKPASQPRYSSNSRQGKSPTRGSKPGQGQPADQPGDQSSGDKLAAGGKVQSPTASPRQGDANPDQPSRANRSWMTGLPPAARRSIKSLNQHPPPPGYAQRLRKYFSQN